MAKKKYKVIAITAITALLIAGAITTLTAGVLTNWTFTDYSKFNEVKIESQEVEYDGLAHELNYSIPEEATYTVEIKKNDTIVNECVEIGEYVYTFSITIDETTKQYEATLSIVEPKNSTKENISENGIILDLVRVLKTAEGDVSKVFTYTINPSQALDDISISVAWANDSVSSTDDDTFKVDKTVTDYVTASIDNSAKEVTITNVAGTAFASKVIVTLQSASNTEATATVGIDYRKKYENTTIDTRASGYYTGDSNFYFDQSTQRVTINVDELASSGSYLLTEIFGNPTGTGSTRWTYLNNNYSVGTLAGEETFSYKLASTTEGTNARDTTLDGTITGLSTLGLSDLGISLLNAGISYSGLSEDVYYSLKSSLYSNYQDEGINLGYLQFQVLVDGTIDSSSFYNINLYLKAYEAVSVSEITTEVTEIIF